MEVDSVRELRNLGKNLSFVRLLSLEWKPDTLKISHKTGLVKTFDILPVSQLYLKWMYIERLPTITELVISPYLTISQQLFGFKKLSFVGDITGISMKIFLWFLNAILVFCSTHATTGYSSSLMLINGIVDPQAVVLNQGYGRPLLSPSNLF